MPWLLATKNGYDDDDDVVVDDDDDDDQLEKGFTVDIATVF